MITYYGRHYVAYFYSQKYDTWVQFNDSHLKSVGNFKEVARRCVSGRQRPVTVFYEHEDVIVNVISAGGGAEDLTKKRDKNFYFTEKAMKKNNFWNGKGGESSGCYMFQ